MRASIISGLSLLALASAQTGKLGDAQPVTNNPAGAAYLAAFPESATTTVRGSVIALGSPAGVTFAVNITGIPSEGGPFIYHIHDQPVPEDGNCTKTLAHLDPYQRGEDPPCDATKPATCQVGDLSGKYGKVPANSTHFVASYSDPYAALVPGIGSYFGNRSIVFHFANKTRITCANFGPIQAHASGTICGMSSSSSSPGAAASSSSPTTSVKLNSTTTSPPLIQQTANGAPKSLANGGALLSAVVLVAALML